MSFNQSLILISMDFHDFIQFPFSPQFNDISKHLEVRYATYFQFSSWCLVPC